MRSALTLLLLLFIAAITAAGCGGPDEGALEASRERAEKQHGPEGGGGQDNESEEDAENSADEGKDSGENSELEVATSDEDQGDDEKADETTGGKAAAQVDLAEGKELFTASCATCHALADAGASGTFGPSMDDLKPSAEETLEQIRKGGGGMPANLVQGKDAETVAAYVAAVAGK